MKKAMTSALGGLVMLLSACGGVQVRQDVASETESHEGFEIEYSPQGFVMSGEDEHDHHVFYSWRSGDGSGRLYLLREDSVSTLRDEDGNGIVDSYTGPEMMILRSQYPSVNSDIRDQIQQKYEEHLRDELPVRHAQERWNQRWQSGPRQ